MPEEIFDNLDDWNRCIWSVSPDRKDEVCGLRPGQNPVSSGGKVKDRGIVGRLKDSLLNDQSIISVPTDFVGPPGPINSGVVGPEISGLVLTPDARPVEAGEVVDGGLVPQLWYAPNKAAGAAIRALPRPLQVPVAIVFPWLFWLLVAGYVYSKLRRK